MAAGAGALIHIAAPHVQVGQVLRQRCAWCGALLLEYHLARLQVPVEHTGPPATWPAGELVRVDGAVSELVPHTDGAVLPDGACAGLDDAVTR